MIESFDNWGSIISYIKLSNITLVITRKEKLREQIVLGKVNELALTTQAKFSCLDGTIANMMGTLGKITDTVVPMSAICPTPMAKYNSWTAPTTTPATGA